jgi:hypothetical protein
LIISVALSKQLCIRVRGIDNDVHVVERSSLEPFNHRYGRYGRLQIYRLNAEVPCSTLTNALRAVQVAMGLLRRDTNWLAWGLVVVRVVLDIVPADWSDGASI